MLKIPTSIITLSPNPVVYAVGQFVLDLNSFSFISNLLLTLPCLKQRKKIKSRIKMNVNLHEHCEPPLNIKFLGAAVHEEIRGETWG